MTSLTTKLNKLMVQLAASKKMKIHVFTDCDLDGAASLLTFNWLVNDSNTTYTITRVTDFRRTFLEWLKSNNIEDYEKIFIIDLDVSQDSVDIVDRENIIIIDHHDTHVENASKYKNATSDNFKQLAEEEAEQDFDKFFDQWVYNGTGIIRAEYSVETNSDGERFLTQIKIDQTQSGYKEYNFPVDARFIGMQDTVTLSGWVDADNSVLKFETKFKPQNIVLDPDFWLLADFQKIVQ